MNGQHKNTRGNCVGNDEVQIEARFGMPLVGDRAFPGTAWYKVDVQTGKVTIHYYEDGEKTEEFDIKEVELSGEPIGHDPCAPVKFKVSEEGMFIDGHEIRKAKDFDIKRVSAETAEVVLKMDVDELDVKWTAI